MTPARRLARFIHLIPALCAVFLAACAPLRQAQERARLKALTCGLDAVQKITPSGVCAVPLIADRDHAIPVVRVRANDGAPFSMIIDTGGNETIISARRARENEVIQSESESRIITAFGNREKSTAAFIRSLKMGTLELQGVFGLVHFSKPRAGLPRGLGELNVLGTPTLASFSWLTLDYAAHRATFSATGDFPRPTPGRALALPLHITPEGHFSTEITIPGHRRFPVIVDTGFDGVLLLSPAMIDTLGLGTLARRGLHSTAIGLGATSRGTTFLIPEMSLGGNRFQHILVWSGPTSEPILLGSGFLQNFRTTFDFKRAILWLEPR